MAEQNAAQEKVIHLLNHTNGVVGLKMAFDGYRMPTKGKVGLCYLPQVRIGWEMEDGGKLDPRISLELYEYELASSDEIPASLDEAFIRYAKEGQVELGRRGMVQFISKDRPPPLATDTFRLQPALPRDCWEDPAQAGSRLRAIADSRRSRQHMRIDLRWKQLRNALHNKRGALVQHGGHGKFLARFYQREETAEGMAVWVGRLPSLDLNQLRFTDGMSAIESYFNGVTVCLTPEFIKNLEIVIEHVTLPHMRHLQDAYWGTR